MRTTVHQLSNTEFYGPPPDVTPWRVYGIGLLPDEDTFPALIQPLQVVVAVHPDFVPPPGENFAGVLRDKLIQFCHELADNLDFNR